MPGPAPRLAAAAALLWALLIPATPARASPVGTADGPADVALAIGVTTAAATATGLWLRSRYRRTDAEPDGTDGGGDP